ncbi:MAG: InlB B-repeat-containing protein, partial [Prevotellaceae bacterium]|nr:InlB B-repeat-containing protein [Candidatus Colivivens caballi]
MKQKSTFLKVFMTLMLLCGVSSAWADVATLTFTKACGGSGTDNQGHSWTVTSDAAESTYDETKGVHYGTGSKAVSYLTLTSSAFEGNVTKVEVNCSDASKAATISVTVGGANFGSSQNESENNNVKYTFEPTAEQASMNFTGSVVVKMSKTSAKKALYVKSIAVTYETAAGTKYKVTYDGNEATSGSVPTDANEYEKNATVTVLGNTGDLAKVGYTFDGWNTKADATGTGYAAGSTFNIQQNTTLYAKWNAIQYNITTNVVEGGSCAVMIGKIAAATATKGTKLTLSNSPDAGYKFEKYVIDYTKENGEPGQSNITTDSYNMPASDITVTPVFSKLATFTITLNNRGNVTTIDNVIENSNLYDALVGQEPSDEFDGY